MRETLTKFKNLEIDKTQLKKEIGDDLYNVYCPRPLVINKEDVIKVIHHYTNNIISVQHLVDWVNIVWFTDLYEVLENESDSIMSVLEALETLDEDGISLSIEEFSKMIKMLSNNSIYD